MKYLEWKNRKQNFKKRNNLILNNTSWIGIKTKKDRKQNFRVGIKTLRIGKSKSQLGTNETSGI